MVIRKIMDEDFDRFLSNVEKSLPSDKSTLRPAKPQNIIGYVFFVCTNIIHLILTVKLYAYNGPY